MFHDVNEFYDLDREVNKVTELKVIDASKHYSQSVDEGDVDDSDDTESVKIKKSERLMFEEVAASDRKPAQSYLKNILQTP